MVTREEMKVSDRNDVEKSLKVDVAIAEVNGKSERLVTLLRKLTSWKKLSVFCQIKLFSSAADEEDTQKLQLDDSGTELSGNNSPEQMVVAQENNENIIETKTELEYIEENGSPPRDMGIDSGTSFSSREMTPRDPTLLKTNSIDESAQEEYEEDYDEEEEEDYEDDDDEEEETESEEESAVAKGKTPFVLLKQLVGIMRLGAVPKSKMILGKNNEASVEKVQKQSSLKLSDNETPNINGDKTKENIGKEDLGIDLEDPEIIKATTTLQAGFRGAQTRKNLKENQGKAIADKIKMDGKDQAEDIHQSNEKNFIEHENEINVAANLKTRSTHQEKDENIHIEKVDNAENNQDSVAEQEVKEVETDLGIDLEDPDVIKATTTLQAGFRGAQTRKTLKEKQNNIKCDSIANEVKENTNEQLPKNEGKVDNSPTENDDTIKSNTIVDEVEENGKEQEGNNENGSAIKIDLIAEEVKAEEQKGSKEDNCEQIVHEAKEKANEQEGQNEDNSAENGNSKIEM